MAVIISRYCHGCGHQLEASGDLVEIGSGSLRCPQCGALNLMKHQKNWATMGPIKRCLFVGYRFLQCSMVTIGCVILVAALLQQVGVPSAMDYLGALFVTGAVLGAALAAVVVASEIRSPDRKEIACDSTPGLVDDRLAPQQSKHVASLVAEVEMRRIARERLSIIEKELGSPELDRGRRKALLRERRDMETVLDLR